MIRQQAFINNSQNNQQDIQEEQNNNLDEKTEFQQYQKQQKGDVKPAFPDFVLFDPSNSKTYANIIQVLQKAYKTPQDYVEIQKLTPANIYEVEYSSSVSTLTSTLFAFVDKFEQMQQYLLLILQDFAPEQQTRVYTIDFSVQNCKSENFFEGHDGVWSINYIFYNVVKNRALLFVLKATEYESMSESVAYSCNNSFGADEPRYNEISQDQISEFSGNKYVFI